MRRLFLDTSVISAYCDERRPIRQRATRIWFDEDIHQFEVFISELVLDELRRTPDSSKVDLMLGLLSKIDVQELKITDEVQRLASLYRNEILAKEVDDTVHLATTTCYGLDAIVSWNFRHIVNLKTMLKIHQINEANGYKIIEIVTIEQLGGGKEYGRV